MYLALLIAHGLFRWVVILAGAAVIASAAWSLMWGQPYAHRHSSLGRAFAITLDLQVVIGTLLYAVFSPLTTVANGLGITAPAGSEMHFFTATHVQVMAGALVCVHVSSGLVRRSASSRGRLWRALVGYGLTLTVLLAGVPWWRPLLRL